MKPKQIAIIAGIVIALIITLQNLDSVRVDILFWDFSFPLILLLYIALGLGFLAGYMMGGPSRRKNVDALPPERRPEGITRQ